MPIIKPKGMIIKRAYRQKGVGTVIEGHQKRSQIKCPKCGEKKNLWKKEKIVREVMHAQILQEQIILQWNGYRWKCQNCKSSFREQFPGLLSRRQYTESYRKDVFNLHKAGVSQQDMRPLRKIGITTTSRWFHELLARKEKEYETAYQYPERIGIGEHRFIRKTKFLTTLCDLSNHRILDIIEGRSGKELIEKLRAIPGREKVKVVNMDMSKTYRSIVKEVFPNAKIVTDRFHVIRLVNRAFLKTIQELHKTQKYKKSILTIWRKHEWRLTEKQKVKKEAYFNQFPHLLPIYEYKQRLMKLLRKKHQTAKQCKKLIPKLRAYLNQLSKEQFEPLKTLHASLLDWIEGLVNMWRYTKSNSITEGFHRKMKLIQRRAYGFRNFQNYRLRVRILCGAIKLNTRLI